MIKRFMRSLVAAELKQLDTHRKALETRSVGSLFKAGMENFGSGDRIQNYYSQVDMIYIAASTNAQSIASIDYKIKSGDVSDPDHPLLKILSAPNQAMIGNRIIFEATQLYLELRGKSYWWLREFGRSNDAPTGSGKVPHKIQVLHPDRMKPKVVKGSLVGYEYKESDAATPIPLSVEEIIQFKYFDPDNQFDGLGPLEAARLNAKVGWRSTTFQDKFFDNGAMPPFYVYTPPEVGLGAEERTSLRSRLSRYLGLKNAYTPMIMGRGTELRSIAVNQRDAEWVLGQQLTGDRVLAIFKVPPAVAGFHKDANKADATEQKRFYWTKTIPPKLNSISSVIQVRLLDEFWGGSTWHYELRGAVAKAIPEDVQSNVEAAHKLFTMGVPPAEALNFLRLDIDTDEAQYPWLHTGYLPFNVVPAASIASGDTEDDGGGEEESMPRMLGDKVERSLWPTDEHWRRELWRRYARTMDTVERNYLGSYRKFWDWFELQVLGFIEGRMKELGEGLPGIAKLVTKDGEEFIPLAVVWKAKLLESVRAPTQQSVKEGWISILAELDIEDDFNLFDPRILSIFNERSVSVVGATDLGVSKMRRSIAEGLQNGEGVDDIQHRVRQYVKTYRAGQARTIARTETAAGFNGARFGSMKAQGIERHQWLSARDEDVRPNHSDEDGNEVAVGEEFPVTQLLHPNDHRGPAEEVVNCRCVVLPVVKKRP